MTASWMQSEKYAKVDKHLYRDETGKEFTQFTISYPDGSGELVRVPKDSSNSKEQDEN